MKVVLVTLLLALLCTTQVLSLRCFTCDDDTDDICKTVVECPSADVYCKAYTTSDRIVRTCEQFCVDDNFTTCCQEDECEE